jgi:osmotically-inducible protein OsmY
MSLAQGSKVLPTSCVRAIPLPEAPVKREDVVAWAAEARLRQSPYAELRRVRCRFREGVLVLHGRVSCYYLKQVAQHLVRRLTGVVEIENRLDVSWTPFPWAWGA